MLGGGSIPCYLRMRLGPGWPQVGDAGMVIGPWSGQGPAQASSHSLILTSHLNVFLQDDLEWHGAMKAYQQERNEFSQKAHRQTCTCAIDLRPMTQSALKRRGLV